MAFGGCPALRRSPSLPSGERSPAGGRGEWPCAIEYNRRHSGGPALSAARTSPPSGGRREQLLRTVMGHPPNHRLNPVSGHPPNGIWWVSGVFLFGGCPAFFSGVFRDDENRRFRATQWHLVGVRHCRHCPGTALAFSGNPGARQLPFKCPDSGRIGPEALSTWPGLRFRKRRKKRRRLQLTESRDPGTVLVEDRFSREKQRRNHTFQEMSLNWLALRASRSAGCGCTTTEPRPA